ncbi:hypothetical protein ACL6C3_13685 [Capilliphycus salinus ALCB114379]
MSNTLLMQLSEVYLAYDTVTSSRTDAPNFVLLDQSISSRGRLSPSV